MQAKNGRLNSDFQIIHFLIGSCHTADAAYALLCDLRDERQLALNANKVKGIRLEAVILTAQAQIDSDNTLDQIEGRAVLTEIELEKDLHDRNVKAAECELTFIDECIARLQPYRKYNHLPDAEAHQACHQEEWLHELIFRAQNYLLTTGSIHVDHFSTMRMHPEFKSAILPAIAETKKHIEAGTIESLFSPREGSPKKLLSSIFSDSSDRHQLEQQSELPV